MNLPPARFVETLRKRGIKLTISHHRWVTPASLSPTPRASILTRLPKHSMHTPFLRGSIETRGGLTTAAVRLPDGREFKGEARCSCEDTYNRRLGVWIAVKRALAQAKACPVNPEY